MSTEAKCPVSGQQSATGACPVSGQQSASGACPVSGQQPAAGGACPVSGQQSATGGCPVSGQPSASGSCPVAHAQPGAPAQASDPSKPTASSLPPEAIELATRLFNMARKGDMTLITYVENGIPPNLTNHDGNTLLMLAAYAGHAELVRELLKKGADVDRPNDRGQTPLAGAVFKLHDDVVKALLEGGADPNKGTPSAIDTARMFMRDEVLKLFEVS